MSGQPTATPYAANSFLGTIAPLGKFLSVLGFILIGILGLVGAVTFSLNINDRGRHVYHLPGGQILPSNNYQCREGRVVILQKQTQ